MSYLTEVLADTPDHFWRAADPGGFLVHDVGSAPFTIALPAESLPYTGPNSDGGSFALTATGGARSLSGVGLASPRTLECWYYPILNPPAGVFICAFDGNAANQWGLSTDGAGHVAMSVNGANVISGTVLVREVWHHIVGAYDGANARLYLDAVLIGGPTAIGAPANVGRQVCWGSSIITTGIAYGAIGECATYNAGLSAARVTAHFNAADNRSSSPVFRGGAISTGGGSGGSTLSVDLSSVLAAVKADY